MMSLDLWIELLTDGVALAQNLFEAWHDDSAEVLALLHLLGSSQFVNRNNIALIGPHLWSLSARCHSMRVKFEDMNTRNCEIKF